VGDWESAFHAAIVILTRKFEENSKSKEKKAREKEKRAARRPGQAGMYTLPS
jgi:hypothetical protein